MIPTSIQDTAENLSRKRLTLRGPRVRYLRVSMILSGPLTEVTLSLGLPFAAVMCLDSALRRWNAVRHRRAVHQRQGPILRGCLSRGLHLRRAGHAIHPSRR